MGRFHLSILTAGLAMTVLSPIIPGGVVIEFGMENTPTSGTSVPLTISIQKGGLDYFGRILLAIPDDCTLSPKTLHGGSFALDQENGRAVVSWLKLPEADRFDLQFELKVAPGATPGTREMTSEFSFIRTQDRHGQAGRQDGEVDAPHAAMCFRGQGVSAWVVRLCRQDAVDGDKKIPR